MSFDLRIHFVGLTLFVPEDNRHMHVLLPATKDHVHPGHEGPIETHFARVLYDEAYEHPGRTQLSRKYVHVDLQGRLLDLTGLSVADPAIDTHLPDELPSMDRVGGPVDRRHVEALPDEKTLAGRITADAGALTFYGLGAAFHLNDPANAQRMAVRTEWTVRGITSRKPATEGGWQVLPEQILQSADTTKKVVRIPELYPIGQTIHLLVFHAVAQEFPPHGEDFRIEQPNADDEGTHHFLAYYTLCRSRAATEPIPVPAAESLRVDVSGDAVDDNGEHTPGMTCVQAQARLASDSPVEAVATSDAGDGGDAEDPRSRQRRRATRGKRSLENRAV